MYRSKLNEKLQESLAAVLPILAIVLILSFTIAPLPTSVLMAFLFGAVLLVVGMMFFSLGAELAMSPMGERVGACITKTRRVGIMLTLGFLLGFLITISEPDLQVLANQVQAVPNMVLTVTVAVEKSSTQSTAALPTAGMINSRSSVAFAISYSLLLPR